MITTEAAIQRVKGYMNLSEETNRFVEVDREENDEYIIQVYQIVNNPDDVHRATDAWWRVNKITGVISDL